MRGGLLWLAFFVGANVLAAGVFLGFGKTLQWLGSAEDPLAVLVVGYAALAVAIAVALYVVRAIGRLRRSRARAQG